VYLLTTLDDDDRFGELRSWVASSLPNQKKYSSLLLLPAKCTRHELVA
jgi:hypothetical protein